MRRAKMMNIDKFLKEIHPGGPIYISTQKYFMKDGVLKKGAWVDTKCKDHQEALKKISIAKLEGLNTYHSIAMFDADSNSREVENALKMCSFFIDVDSGADPKKYYKTVPECEVAINKFLSSTNVPKPSIIVCSGNGYHCYWVLNQTASIGEWLPVAKNLKELCLKNNFHIDKAPTADASRVLRTVGTKNFKDPTNPKLVQVIYPKPNDPVVRYDFNAFSDIITGELSKLNCAYKAMAVVQVEKKLPNLPTHYPATNINDLPIILKKIDPNCSREIWLAVGMGCVDEYGEDAKDAFFKWSQGSFHEQYQYGTMPPDNFDVDEIETQWSDWIKRKLAGKTGYTFGTVRWHAENGEAVSNPADGVSEIKNQKILGDRQNATLFAAKYRGEFMYVWGLGHWYRWDRVVWRECIAGEETAAAKAISDLIADTAVIALKEDSQNARPLLMHALKAQNSPHIRSMVELARSEPSMSERNVSNLNRDPYLLGVKNGVVDLRVGTLVNPDPAMLITKQCNANFVKNSDCDLWIQFLNQIFSDPETIESLQRIIGYTFTGSTIEEIMVICHGYGANGKSVMSNVLQKIAGDYGKTGSSNLLKARKDDDTGPRPDIASLCGARFVSVNEMQSGDYLDEQAVKILASREEISARHLYQNEFSYTPTAVIWLKTNHKPIIKGEDDGIWRRLVLLPFDRKFAEHERDRNLEEKLMAQADGILEWIIDGAVKWYASGLKLSPQIICQSSLYRTESDLLGQFFEDEINMVANAKSLDSATYYEYTRWCTTNGTRALAKKRFTQKLAERGIGVAKSNGSRYYSGIELKNSLGKLMEAA
jgi:putative DNA primase/helicase